MEDYTKVNSDKMLIGAWLVITSMGGWAYILSTIAIDQLHTRYIIAFSILGVIVLLTGICLLSTRQETKNSKHKAGGLVLAMLTVELAYLVTKAAGDPTHWIWIVIYTIVSVVISLWVGIRFLLKK